MRIKRIFLLSFLLSGVLMIGYILLQTKRSSFIYSDFGVQVPKDYSLLGIDVSHHQGEIIFNETVQKTKGGDSLEFVYIKATEGTDFRDRNYDKNAEGFAAHKMNYGFYHYYLPHESAEAQAVFFCETIKSFNIKLLPVVDIEVIDPISKTNLIDSLTLFMNRVEAILLYRPMIYTYTSFYEDYLLNTELENELFWLANYSRDNPYMEKENVILWQFTDRATINGIATFVDLNVAKPSFRDSVIIVNRN